MTPVKPKGARIGLTRQGGALAGLAVLVGLAGANTGANLLFLVLGLLCGTLLVSACWGRRALGRLTLSLELPELIESGAMIPVRLRFAGSRVRSLVVRGGPFLPAGGVLVADTVAGSEDSASVATYSLRAPARGRIDTVDVELVTRAPFHLVEHRAARGIPIASDVHPALWPRQGSGPRASMEGTRDTRLPGQGGSIRNIRPYVPGDNPRHMDWRASARTGDLQLREYHREARPRVAVVLETSASPGPGFEAAASGAASAVRDALLEGHEVELHVGPDRLDLGSPRDLARALRALARIIPDPRSGRPARPARGARVVAFGGPASPPPASGLAASRTLSGGAS